MGITLVWQSQNVDVTTGNLISPTASKLLTSDVNTKKILEIMEIELLMKEDRWENELIG